MESASRNRFIFDLIQVADAQGCTCLAGDLALASVTTEPSLSSPARVPL